MEFTPKRTERCQRVTGSTWKHDDPNRLCSIISPDMDSSQMISSRLNSRVLTTNCGVESTSKNKLQSCILFQDFHIWMNESHAHTQ
jgi:hypothetical protein